MSSTSDHIQKEGVVINELPNDFYRVELNNDEVVLAKASGDIRRHNINIIEGDVVKVNLSVADLSKGILKERVSD